MKDLTEIIENMIREKSWDQLTPEEMELLEKQEIDKVRFNVMKSLDAKLGRIAAKEMDEVGEDQEVLGLLKQKLKPEKDAPSFSLSNKLKLLLNFRVPVYQPVLVIMLIILSFIFFERPQPENMVSPNQEIVYKTDTVYRQLPQDTVTVMKVKYVNRYIKEKRQEPYNNTLEVVNTEDHDAMYDAINDIFPPQVGLTMDENKSIPEFIVSDK